MQAMPHHPRQGLNETTRFISLTMALCRALTSISFPKALNDPNKGPPHRMARRARGNSLAACYAVFDAFHASWMRASVYATIPESSFSKVKHRAS